MDLFDTFFGELLMTFLIAMVPVLELRGAIPAGIAAGLPPAAAAAPRHRAWGPHRLNHYHHRDLRRHSSLLVSFAVRV